MTPEIVQLLYCAGFAVLGWYLRHRGLMVPPANPPTPLPDDPRRLVELLRALLDRLDPPK
jgi:hypothetical protein